MGQDVERGITAKERRDDERAYIVVLLIDTVFLDFLQQYQETATNKKGKQRPRLAK